MTVQVIVRGENILEREDPVVARLYPCGMHTCIADALNAQPGIVAGTATLEEAEHGLTAERLAATDVLVWWGHRAHERAAVHVVERVAEPRLPALGALLQDLPPADGDILLAEVADRGRARAPLGGCAAPSNRPWPARMLRTRDGGDVWRAVRGAGAARDGLISWLEGGEVFRSGLTYQRGAGKVFYFRPGHETYPTYYDANVRLVLANAVRWAHNHEARLADVASARNVPAGEAPEPLGRRH